MSVHYSAIICSLPVRLAGFQEIVLHSGEFAYVSDSLGGAERRLEEVLAFVSDACVLIYDDRIGFRKSIVVQDGKRVTYDEGDELWVPLDDEGEPNVSATPLRLQQLKEDEEYETIKNAIDLGLDRFGVPMSSREFLAIVRT